LTRIDVFAYSGQALFVAQEALPFVDKDAFLKRQCGKSFTMTRLGFDNGPSPCMQCVCEVYPTLSAIVVAVPAFQRPSIPASQRPRPSVPVPVSPNVMRSAYIVCSRRNCSMLHAQRFSRDYYSRCRCEGHGQYRKGFKRRE
jgi:hypothetical protein